MSPRAIGLHDNDITGFVSAVRNNSANDKPSKKLRNQLLLLNYVHSTDSSRKLKLPVESFREAGVKRIALIKSYSAKAISKVWRLGFW